MAEVLLYEVSTFTIRVRANGSALRGYAGCRTLMSELIGRAKANHCRLIDDKLPLQQPNKRAVNHPSGVENLKY